MKYVCYDSFPINHVAGKENGKKMYQLNKFTFKIAL